MSAEADKATKFEARYTPKAKMPEERCGKCRYFLEPDGCRLVRGDVSPQGWCKFFDERSR